MIWLGNGKIKLEKNEPAMRSCWECNKCHEGLKKVNCLHVCYDCGRYWVFDRFLDSLKSDEEFDKFFKDKGMKVGDSTTKIDAGYRITVMTFKSKEKP